MQVEIQQKHHFIVIYTKSATSEIIKNEAKSSSKTQSVTFSQRNNVKHGKMLTLLITSI